MDRQIVYPGQTPLETDLLNTNRYAMAALGLLAQDVLGTGTMISGMGCTQTVAPSMAVLVAAGRIYSVQNLDGTAYSSLAADTAHQLVKQGISLDPVTLSCAAPSTAGFSVCYLIEAAYQDVDSVSVTLPYYNASNPTQPYSGPANAGTSQSTVRAGKLILQAKAGIAAATGSQSVPSADSGYVGVWVVTVANGQTTITSANIAAYSGAPFFTPLPTVITNLALSGDATKGAGLVGFSPALTYPAGTVGAALKSGAYVAAFSGAVGDGVTDDTAALLDAFAKTPQGGTLVLRGVVGNVFRTTGVSVTRSNIAIVGDMKPRANATNTALIGGTTILGTFLIDGDNLLLEKFGVDNGINYTNTYRSSLGGNGLVVHSITQTVIRRNINVKDVIGMARIGDLNDMQAAFHAVLLEGLEGGSSNNVTGIGGWYGVVVKASNWTFNGLIGIQNDTVGVYIKSNSYGPVANVTGCNVIAIAGSSRMYVGFLVQASDAELDNVTVAGVTVIGGMTPVRIEGETSQPAVDVEISGVSSRNTLNGASFRGPVYGSRISGVIDGPSSGMGLEVAINTTSVQPIDVTADLRINVASAQASANHVNITTPNTKVFLTRATVTVGFGAPGNLLITANTQLGDIYGKLSSDRVTTDLQNGWAVFVAGQSCGVVTRNGVTMGYGRIKAGAATSPTFYTLPPGAFPSGTDFFATISGFDGTTNKPAPVFVQVIGATGACSIYPSIATYSTNLSYYDLSNMRFMAQLPVTGAV